MHASGIRIDDAASSAFAAAAGDPQTLYQRFVIAHDKFVQSSKGHKANTLQGNWQEIQKAFSSAPNDPCFLLARGLTSSPSKWLLIFYMPDGCTVRDRMVYAASVAALKDGLGQSNFEAAIFSCGSPKDATQAEYESVSRQMSQDDLLTLDEKAKLEGETQSAMAMSSTKTRAIVGLPIKASEDALSALANVQKGAPTSLLLSLNSETEELQVAAQGNFTFDALSSKLPADEPRYLLVNFQHDHEGSSVSSIVFGYYCPDGIKPKLKMFYSTCKQMVVKMVEACGMTINKSMEFSEAKELSNQAVMEELYPAATAKKSFAKPSRPGRGNARLIRADGTAATSPSSASSAASASPSP